MSIVRSYNKHTGISYAYELSSVWDDSKKKNVQRKKCIGQFEPGTDKIIPNGRRGRPRKETATVQPVLENSVPLIEQADHAALVESLDEIAMKISSIENTFQQLQREINSLSDAVSQLKSRSVQ